MSRPNRRLVGFLVVRTFRAPQKFVPCWRGEKGPATDTTARLWFKVKGKMAMEGVAQSSTLVYVSDLYVCMLILSGCS
jgi:acyl-CoA thioesterase